MKQAFQYNLIRFQPDVETEEFAVVGIAVYSPATYQLAYHLLKSEQYQRIYDFFNPINQQVLPSALEMIETELQRVKKLLPEVERPDDLYGELIREREDIIRFGPTSVIAYTDVESCADELFQRYVDRKCLVAAA